MHAVGLHSALAIKRQRKRRDEQRRARERRYSSQSGESGFTSPRASTASLDHHFRHQPKAKSRNSSTPGMVDSKVVTSIGMLHIGVVFLVLGAFLLVSGLLPNDITSWGPNISGKWWNELVAIGLFSVIVGCFLIALNRLIAKKEEDDLEKYVQRQLTRSKSGHRLERDIETGGLTTKHAKRAKQYKNAELVNNISIETETELKSLPKSPPPAYSSITQECHPIIQSTASLEQITEEEIISERLGTSTANSLSPTSPIETKLLLKNTLNTNDLYKNQLHEPLCIGVSEI